MTSTRVERLMRRRHAGLHRLPLNFDPARYDMSRPQPGWHVDDYRQPLPPEPPGPPVAGGSWEIARDLVSNYAYADPGIIREVYPRSAPKPGKNMLLQGRFYGLRFYLGLRVGEVVDGFIEQNGRQARVYGWNYRTLQGHLERGQMDQQVRKWLDSGEVEFHVHAFSQRAHIPNPIVRLGFILFGRVTQVRFYNRACRRMATLTKTALTDQPPPWTRGQSARAQERRTRPRAQAPRLRRRRHPAVPADRTAGRQGHDLLRAAWGRLRAKLLGDPRR